MNAQPGVSWASPLDQLPMTWSVLMRAMKVMNSEAPSSTPMIGRNESDRNSKKESTQLNRPRMPPARAAALTSASVGLSSPLAPASAICGRAMMSL